ncbi:hypothetical protein PILCRDRAFT_815391 [Piloderma croceum F 1598]|uniref:Uncharacterized protein n=1 Tax=Piloderma croceum (strain F 1598) TaxID=765440 RepID=A0A0C3FS68_PILCF|nr:hypothetical protein PILCRDRAFT_815391 [Piloderma croceum F 1598]
MLGAIYPASSSTDLSTRRQVTADALQVFVVSETMEIVGGGGVLQLWVRVGRLGR